MSAEIMPSWW